MTFFAKIPIILNIFPIFFASSLRDFLHVFKAFSKYRLDAEPLLELLELYCTLFILYFLLFFEEKKQLSYIRYKCRWDLHLDCNYISTFSPHFTYSRPAVNITLVIMHQFQNWETIRLRYKKVNDGKRFCYVFNDGKLWYFILYILYFM